jgi:hypothetical protein
VCLDSTSLKEFTCVRGGIIDTVTIECAHGCSEGACKQGSNEYRNGAVFCSDTDGGAVAMKLGTVTTQDSAGKKSSNTDYCGSGFQKDSIYEFRCEAPGQYSTFVWSCVHGCQDGACLPGLTPYQAVSQPVVAEPPAGFEKEVTTENPFTDIDPKTEKGKAALYLYEHAIAGGYPDGEFKGWRLVNRAEASKFLLNGLGITTNLSLKNDGRFSDVQEREWYVPYVIESANRGIVKGDDGKKTFRPADGVNTAEFLAMLARTFELETGFTHEYTDVGEGDWYKHFAGIAWKYGLFLDRGGSLLPEKALTRDEVANSIMKIHQNFNK